MRYVGSKGKHVKQLLPIIQKYLKPDVWYIEPFGGGANIFSEVKHSLKWYNDLNPEPGYLLERLADDPMYLPPKQVSEQLYKAAKENPELVDPADYAFMAYCCSFGGKKWGGYARSLDAKGNLRDMVLEQYNAVLTQKHGLYSAKFTYESYLDLDIPDNSVVYCDPPYEATLGYGSTFNHTEYWKWVYNLSKRCIVLCSEYESPVGFTRVWSKPVKNNVGFTRKEKTESLFMWDHNFS